MGTMRSVKNWLCKCGMSLQVVAEIDPSKTVSVTVKCPNCGNEEKFVSAYNIISIRLEKGPEWDENIKVPPRRKILRPR